MAFVVSWNIHIQEVQDCYHWLDLFCPSWEFEASYRGKVSSKTIRENNEDFLKKTQNKVRRIDMTVRVQSEKEAMAIKLHYLDTKVMPIGR